MTNAERIIAAAHTAFDAGPMGASLRPDDYRKFVSCDLNPALAEPFQTSDIGLIKTSCAVVVRAVLHAAGRRSISPGRVGQPILGGWLERLTFQHPAWEDSRDSKGTRRNPPAGAVFYRAYSKASKGTESHVGILLFETTPGFWVTCEGGGSPSAKEVAAWKLTDAQTKLLNGTLSRISSPKDVWAKDGLGRVLIGWWRPELIDGFDPIVEKSQMHSWRTLDTGEVEVDGQVPVIFPQGVQAFVDRVMRWTPVAATYCQKHNVPLHWALGVMKAESGGNPSALSPDGGYGLMQLTHPGVFMGVAPEDTRDNPNDPNDDITDPERNIDLGVALLGRLRKVLGNDLVKVASAYNAGLNGDKPHSSVVSPYGYRETKGYIDRVIEAANTALRQLHRPYQTAYTDTHVREWQTILGISVDGKFGPGTLAASKKAIGK